VETLVLVNHLSVALAQREAELAVAEALYRDTLKRTEGQLVRQR
jgi:hypothetical protein